MLERQWSGFDGNALQDTGGCLGARGFRARTPHWGACARGWLGGPVPRDTCWTGRHVSVSAFQLRTGSSVAVLCLAVHDAESPWHPALTAT